MSPRAIILVLLAVVFAGGTVYAANWWLNSQRLAMEPGKPEEVVAAPSREVLVTVTSLPTGSFIRPEHLRWQAWPDGDIAETWVTREGGLGGEQQIQGLAGAVVRQGIAAGEPVVAGRVVRPGERGFLAAVLHPGMRAVSVAVNATTAASGFIFPGDRIDLLLTHAPGGRRISETVLTNIRVLATDQSTNDQNATAVVARTVTVEATAHQVEMINVARSIGQLSLSLRSLAREDAIAAADGAAARIAAGQSPDAPAVATARDADAFAMSDQADSTLVASQPTSQPAPVEDSFVPGRGMTHAVDADVSRHLGRGPEVIVLRGSSARRQQVESEAPQDGAAAASDILTGTGDSIQDASNIMN